MLARLLKNTKFLSEVTSFFKKNKAAILDIIIFGSTVKGKEKPNDLDILLVYKDKKDADISYELKKRLVGFNAEIVDKTYKELFETSFNAREALLAEGYSLVYKKFIAEGLGYNNFILFKYELKGFNKSNRMRFYYSLYGRSKNDNGILARLNAKKFSETVLLCPVKNAEFMKEYLGSWHIKFIEFPVLLPSRLNYVLK